MGRLFSFFNKHNYLTWIIVVLITIFIFYISSLANPPNPIKEQKNLIPILYHIIIYLGLSFFLMLALSKKELAIEVIMLAIAVALFYAVFDEIHQLFVPYRSCSFSDFLLDSSGSLSGILLFILISNRRIS